MAQREQHGNREAKKPMKDKRKGGGTAQPSKRSVSEVVEGQTDIKH